MFRLEAALDAQHSRKALQHQTGPGQQQYGERDFGHDQRIARAARCHGPGCRPGAFLQSLVQVGPRELPRGRQAEQHARECRNAEGEAEHRQIECYLIQARNVGRAGRDEQAQPRPAEQYSEHAAHHRQHDAFDQQLPHHSPTSGSQGEAQRNFLLARRRSGEHEIRHVRAGDQQHAGDNTPQHQQRRAHIPTQGLVQQRHHGNFRPDGLAGMRLLDSSLNGDQLALGLCDGDTGLESRDHIVPVR